jgi:hypothetical protein
MQAVMDTDFNARLRIAAHSFTSGYTPDGISHALPIIPFAFRNQRVQRFENLLFTESRDKIC